MQITNCKLSKRIQTNSAILFYRKLCMVISDYSVSVADEIFNGTVELDGNYFGGHRNGRHTV